MRKAGSMSMHSHFSCRIQMAGMRKWRRFIIREPDPLEQIKTLLQSSGLKLLAVYDAYTREAPRADSGRLTFIAKEYGK